VLAMSFLMELSVPGAASRALTRIFYDTLRMDRMHCGGHPLLLFSPASRTTAEAIRAVFTAA
jgi:hypothetical protein